MREGPVTAQAGDRGVHLQASEHENHHQPPDAGGEARNRPSLKPPEGTSPADTCFQVSGAMRE